MELNAHPDRLDLSEHFCKLAKEMNLKGAISTDAHGVSIWILCGSASVRPGEAGLRQRMSLTQEPGNN